MLPPVPPPVELQDSRIGSVVVAKILFLTMGMAIIIMLVGVVMEKAGSGVREKSTNKPQSLKCAAFLKATGTREEEEILATALS